MDGWKGGCGVGMWVIAYVRRVLTMAYFGQLHDRELDLSLQSGAAAEGPTVEEVSAPLVATDWK